jgi:uncharacterized caspase-like protein
MQQTIQIWNLETKQSRTLSGHSGEITSIAFGPDGHFLASAGRDKTILIWELNTGGRKSIARSESEINSIVFSPDGLQLATAHSDNLVRVWDVTKGLLAQTLSKHGGEVLKVVYSPNGKLIASASDDHSIKVWDADTGNERQSLTGPSESVNAVGFSQDGRWLLSGSADGRTMLWDAFTGSLAATLVSVRDSDDWLVVTPDGLFDGSPAAWDLLLWRFAGDTRSVLPVEAFFNEYYYPGLLADILAGKNPKAAKNIGDKDRRQPQIALAVDGDSNKQIDTRMAKVRIDLVDGPPDGNHASGSGARDLRLFRNGLLVKVWPGDVLEGSGKKTLEATIPVIAGENHLSAYAFNRDNVRSSNARLLLNGANSLKRSGSAYVLAIGVGQYENPEYNLSYTVADATALGEQLKSQQERLGHYSPIVVIPLVNQEATKANVLLALKRLSGEDTAALPPNAPTALARIKPAEPEDAVVIYFSGHGAADKDRFYLIPHDLGYKGPRKEGSPEDFRTILSHSITDIELEEALRPLDADQLLLVIDACRSGQALETEEVRRGPMNTRGIAQLAYEKGMYVLTAAQSNEVAFESQALKHSYLAYALVEEGLKNGAADMDQDGNILLREWFAYATSRVPLLRRENRRAAKELIEEADEIKVQRPRAFYTRDSGANQLIIARRDHNSSQ